MPRKNPEGQREYSRNYRATHKEQIRAQQRGRQRKTRDNVLRRKYGITIEEYEAMELANEGKCPICGTDSPGTRGAWRVDHDHATGVVRGLLCYRCNILIGQAWDSPKILRSAAGYLDRVLDA